MAGYYNRFIGYTEDGFQEGVSLTYYDELMRWQKYAWGCSELVFNPIPQWPRKGPLNKLFIRFLMSNIHFYTKVGRQPCINLLLHRGKLLALHASHRKEWEALIDFRHFTCANQSQAGVRCASPQSRRHTRGLFFTPRGGLSVWQALRSLALLPG